MITKKEYEDLSWKMDDHVVAQGILHELDKNGCLSEKGKSFKKMYYDELSSNISPSGKKESLLMIKYANGK